MTNSDGAVALWAFLRPVFGAVAVGSLTLIGWISVEVKSDIAVMGARQDQLVTAIEHLAEAVDKADGKIEHRVENLETRVLSLEKER